MLFERNADGRAADLIVDHLLCNNRDKRYLIGARKDARLQCGCSSDGAVFYGFAKQRLPIFAGYLDYASHRSMRWIGREGLEQRKLENVAILSKRATNCTGRWS